MRGATVKRPLLIYCLVFCVGLAFATVTLATFALFAVARSAEWEAAAREAGDIARRGSVAETVRTVQERGRTVPGQLAVVTATKAALGVTVAEARAAVREPGFGRSRGFVAASVRSPGAEAYVVYRARPGAAFAAAQTEIRALIVGSLLAALIASFVLAMMIGRLVLPPLAALREIADNVEIDAMDATEAPNEITEIARTFRRTLRTLQQERNEIERQHAELERMQAGLIRASKLASVGRLAAGIAHEIGNPLAAVKGYLSLLQRGLGEEERADVLQRSLTELNRIHETIRALLTYARKDDSAAERCPLDTRVVVDEALTLVRGHPALRDVSIETEAAEGSIPDAMGHPAQLGQVVVNLVLNAAQAMNGMSDARVVLRRHVEGGQVLIDVQDHGPGLDPQMTEQIFDPFFTTKPPGEGTGLGLAVSRSLVERMGGDLTVVPTDAAGACFRVSLPASGEAPDNEVA